LQNNCIALDVSVKLIYTDGVYSLISKQNGLYQHNADGDVKKKMRVKIQFLWNEKAS